MIATAPSRLEFFPQSSTRRWLELLGALLLAALIAWLQHDVGRGLIEAVSLSAAFLWSQRRRPILVIDDDGIRLPSGRLGERSLVASGVAAWSWTADGLGLVFQLRSHRTRLRHVRALTATDRSAIAAALMERGYPQFQDAGAELAAIQHDRDRRFQVIGLWFGMLLLIFAAVWLTRGR